MHATLESAFEGAFAASTRVNLGFYYNLSSEVGGDFVGFFWSECDAPGLGGDVKFREKFAGLVFVNIHLYV
jgi:hypothetical protein